MNCFLNLIAMEEIMKKPLNGCIFILLGFFLSVSCGVGTEESFTIKGGIYPESGLVLNKPIGVGFLDEDIFS